MKRAVFLFVIAENCPQCHIYINDKKYGWDSLKSKISTISEIEIKEIHNMTPSRSTLPNYLPEEVRKSYINFYPSFILIPRENYYKQQIDLNGYVYGSTWNNDIKQMIPNPGNTSFVTEDILKWIQNIIQLPEFIDQKTYTSTNYVPNSKKSKYHHILTYNDLIPTKSDIVAKGSHYVDVIMLDNGQPIGKVNVKYPLPK